jgi:hypothetical protein
VLRSGTPAPQAVHRLRRALKACRSLWPLFLDVVPPAQHKHVSRQLARVARRWGRLREDQVLRLQAAQRGLHVPGRARRPPSTTADQALLDRLVLALPGLWRGPLPASVVDAALDDLRHRIRRARRRVDHAADDDAAWHALRKRCKALAVVLGHLQGRRPAARLAQAAWAARVGSLLGDDHDLAVLQQRCAPLEKELRRDLAHERNRLQRKALKATDRLLERLA